MVVSHGLVSQPSWLIPNLRNLRIPEVIWNARPASAASKYYRRPTRWYIVALRMKPLPASQAIRRLIRDRGVRATLFSFTLSRVIVLSIFVLVGLLKPAPDIAPGHFDRSEERRVGKECRSRW